MRSAEDSFGFREEGLKQIVLDSRKEMPDALFVPIVGERSDGHDFIEMAIAHGARAVLSQRDVSELAERYPEVDFYPVEDTREALQEIGVMERGRFSGKVIGVTGSVGKTTTRAMIACALASSAKVFQTAGNANSQVGVPITMFDMARSGADLSVIELGMSEPGEMHRIAEVAQVDIAVITNIGIAHIENLKTQENILREKLHILDGMKDGGSLYVNGEDPLLSQVTRETLDRFGIARGKNIHIYCYAPEKTKLPKLMVRGHHMQQNVAAALAVCRALGIPEEGARDALSHFSGLQGRGEVFETERGITIIDDAYNASPVSMKAGLSVLDELEGKRKIAVLGDMLELGEESPRYHREIGEMISALSLDTVFLYGALSRHIEEGILQQIGEGEAHPAVRRYEDFDALTQAVLHEALPGDVLLFKGSHSMRLGEIVQHFREA